MSLLTKSLSISLLPLFLSLIPLLQFKALALDTTTTSLSLVNTINVASNETDFHALLAFKSNILPGYQQALSSWDESLHFCHWEGVKCGRRHERVTVIDLASRGLTGSLSPYIGNLSFLQELNLPNNTFTGEIPTELGSLFRLQILDLNYNGFEGTIPTSLSRCSNLWYLGVGKNKLVGEFPKELTDSMPRLRALHVYKNNLTGGIPPSIGNLTSLVNITAHSNPWGGSIPNALGQLRNLKMLVLGDTNISDFQGNEFKALVYEFMPNGSLDNWLHPIPSSNSHGGREFVILNLLQRIDIAIDVACALDYLHHQCERPIIHCDLKPSNILLDGDMVAHVGDFGLARFRAKFTTPSTSSSTAIRGTIGYAAPEYGLGSEMSTSGDVYSYGILLLEMITRKRPTDIMFEGDLNLHNFTRIALPQRVMDPMLLTDERNGSKMEYLISIIEIGLACSTESPNDRMSIDIVLRELHLVKNNILKADMEI